MSKTDEIFNPNTGLEIPSWFNESYFTDVLTEDEPDYVKIIKMTPVAAIPPGENFTSLMLRVHIDLEMQHGSIKHKTYIFKTMLAYEKGGKEMNMYNLFPKEMQMYEKFLPAFEDLYKNAGKEVQFAPKCLYCKEHNGVIHIIFEDLGAKNFTNASRTEGLDFVHLVEVLKKLAEFHAASVVYEQLNGPYPILFTEGFVSRKANDFQQAIFELRAETIRQSMVHWNMPNAEIYRKKFPTLKQYAKMSDEVLEVNPNDFNVLNHGDFWTSNIMFNYSNDTHVSTSIDQLMILDYQLCNWGNPAQDLLFFITTSAANDVRIKYFDELIHIYHEHLIGCLQLLKYQKPLPKLRDLQSSMLKQNNTFYAFFAITNHLPLILYPTDKDSNVHTLKGDNEESKRYRMKLFSNPKYTNVLKTLYPFYCHKGLFNFSDFDDSPEAEIKNE